MKEKAERNKQFVKDRESGMTYRQLAKKYGLSEGWAYRLYTREKIKRLLKVKSNQ